MVPAQSPFGAGSQPMGGSDDLVGFYDRTAATAYGLALRIVGRPDVAQAALVAVYREVGSWPGPESERRRMLLIRVRQWALARRDPSVRGATVAAAVPSDGVVAMHRPPKSATAVLSAVAQLEPVDQDLLGLAYWEGRSVSAMAAHTGLPETEVRRRLRNAMARVAGTRSRQLEASK